MYRKSKDGDTYKIFRKLCDNQGATKVLIKSNEGFTIGGYTPSNWDSNSYWKHDNETFLFSLTDNKVFKKKKLNASIYCCEDYGPWFPYIGIWENEKNMNQGKFLYYEKDIHFEDFNSIIPNEGKDKYFEIEEVEVYKIIFN